MSFAMGGVLLLTGAAALRRSWRTPLRWFGAIPLLFGVQQIIEGFQWLVEKPSAVSAALGYAYVFFAFLLWPVYVPFAFQSFESDPRRARLMRWLLAVGIFGALVGVYFLTTRSLVPAEVGNHICYQITVPFENAILSAYLIVVLGAGFASTRPGARIFVIGAFLSFIISFYFYQVALTSVWCIFSAALSVLIYFDLRYSKKI